MLLGHYAAGFAAKKWAPKVSLGVLFLAAVWLDLLWSLFLILHWEDVAISPGITKFLPIDFTSYSLSHSLVMAMAWGVVFWMVSLILTNNQKTSLILGGLVVAHWFLNVITHRPDLYLLPDGNPMGPHWGLGLWNSIPSTIVVELALLGVGVWFYATSTKAIGAQGQWLFWTLCGVLLASFAGLFLMPVPKAPIWVAVEGQIQLIFVVWALWTDDHRKSA
jgi:hypothetical protein